MYVCLERGQLLETTAPHPLSPSPCPLSHHGTDTAHAWVSFPGSAAPAPAG